MIDNHIHIGQFYENYYNPIEIIQIVMEKCTEGLCFSSTTTCKEDITYSEIEREICHTLAHIPWSSDVVQPFFWFIPSFIEQKIVFERAISNLPYKGIKLHPLAHHWDLNNKRIVSALHEIFGYADSNNMPVLIHTGHSGVDAAGTFSLFFPLYPKTNFILAHCRPLAEAVSFIRKYPNVYGDTAFVSNANIEKIIKEGLSQKIYMGSDFPITYYFSNKYPSGMEKINSLEEQYKSDFRGLLYFSSLLNHKLKKYNQ